MELNTIEEVEFEIAGIRIGTMRTFSVKKPSDDVPSLDGKPPITQSIPFKLSEKGVKFYVAKQSNSTSIDLSIRISAKNISKVDCFLLRGCPVIWIKPDKSMAERIRKICGMTDPKGGYINPESSVDVHHFIGVLTRLDPLPLGLAQKIQQIFSKMATRNRVSLEDFYHTISQPECNNRLVAVSAHMDKNWTSSICQAISSKKTAKSAQSTNEPVSDWSDVTSEEEEVVETAGYETDPEIKIVPKKKESRLFSSLNRSEIKSPAADKTIHKQKNTEKPQGPVVQEQELSPTLSNSPPRKLHRARKSIPNRIRAVSIESQLRARVEQQPAEKTDGLSSNKRKHSEDDDSSIDNASCPSPNGNDSPTVEYVKKKTPRESFPWSARSKKMKPVSSSGSSSPLPESQNGVKKDSQNPAPTVNGNDISKSRERVALREIGCLKQEMTNLMQATALCTCNAQSPHTVNLEMGIKCMAVDNISGRLYGCHMPVKKIEMLRPSSKIPELGLCDDHRERMIRHECCPGCGTFCCGGVFLVCFHQKHGPHRFHRDCMVLLGRPGECPHCGGSCAKINEVDLQPNSDTNLRWIHTGLSAEKIERRRYAESRGHSARMCYNVKDRLDSERIPGITVDLSPGISISTTTLFPGNQRDELEKLLEAFKAEAGTKKKFLEKPFLQYVKQNDLLKAMQMLCDSDYSRNGEHDQVLSEALFEAVEQNNVTMVHLLVQCGADVNSKNESKDTPLFEALHRQMKEMMFYLLVNKADASQKDEEGMTCLHHAAKDGFIDGCHLLITYGSAKINSPDDGGWTPIVWAAEHNHTKMAQYLVYHGADLNIVDKEGNICVQWATLSGNLEIVQMCIKAHSDINHCNIHGDSALHIAAREDNYPCVTALLAAGADATLLNKDGQTPTDVSKNGSRSWASLNMNCVLRKACYVQGDFVPFNRERILSPDMSRGYDKIPIACVNAVDDATCPTSGVNSFHYVTENVHKSQETRINAVISGIQSCGCNDMCESSSCVCGLMSEKCWYSKGGTLLPEFDIAEPPLIFECNKMCKCSRSCSNRVVQNGIRYRLQVYRTHGRGWGLRALQTIPKGAFVCDYVGEVISDAEADVREDDSYLFDLENKDGEMFCIDARNYGNVSRFINHLCEPNLIPIRVFVEHHDIRFPKLAYFATREIQAYEELGFDYGDRFWDVKCRQFTCMCRSPRCKYSEEVYKKKAEQQREEQRKEDEEKNPSDKEEDIDEEV